MREDEVQKAGMKGGKDRVVRFEKKREEREWEIDGWMDGARWRVAVGRFIADHPQESTTNEICHASQSPFPRPWAVGTKY